LPPAWRGLPFEPPPVQMTVRLTIAGQALTLSREVVYRYRDQRTGEVRRPLFVTRPFDVAVAPGASSSGRWTGGRRPPAFHDHGDQPRARARRRPGCRDGAAGLDDPPTG